MRRFPAVPGMRSFHAFAISRRRPEAAARPPPEPRATAREPVVEARPALLDAETIDALEADVLKSIGAVTGSIEEASREVAAVSEDLAEVHAHVNDLASAGRGAAAQTLGLAASTEQLSATSADITGAMDVASKRVGEAVQSAQTANALIADLA